MPLAPGSRLGLYEIVALIGAGAMGEVYRGRDLKLNRDVALKVLPEYFADEPERLVRFRREAQVLAALNHPNIAHIHGLEESGNLHALVMELVEGVTLEELIDRRHIAPGELPPGIAAAPPGSPKPGGLPLAATLAVVRQLAEALEIAHEQGIVHRDLKPANIKVRADGMVKVLDFGLARVLGTDGDFAPDVMNAPTMTGHETQFGAVLGTAAYMSPEQARGRTVDRRTDIWAFGALTYEMLTGQRAIKGKRTEDILDAVQHQDVDWTLLPADTPPRLAKLLRRCMERDPLKRLRDIGEARITLEALAGARRRGAGDLGEHRTRTVPDVIGPSINQSPIESLPVALAPKRAWWPGARRAAWDAGIVAAMAAVLLAAHTLVASHPVGARLEALEYSVLEQILLPEPDAAVTWAPDDPRVPVVIDISPLRADKSAPTDRDKLEELVDTLRSLNAAAIGIDVDFSPDDAGNFITPRDPTLFDTWRKYGNVRLGVFRREGDEPKRWLGRPEFQSLAAGIMLPKNAAGLAIQYVSPDLQRVDAKTPLSHGDYLLQLPAALYEISHPGARAGMIADPLLGRAAVDDRIQFGTYPMNFSFLPHIVPIPYKEKRDLDLWAKKIDRKVVIIGDTSDALDTRCTQARAEPVSGVLLHATALATLNQGIFHQVDDYRRLLYNLLACLGAVAVISAVRWLASRPLAPGRFDARGIEILAFSAGACFVLAAAALTIAFQRVFWPDPFWLAAALILLPYLKEVWSILRGGIRTTKPISASSSTGGTTHVA